MASSYTSYDASTGSGTVWIKWNCGTATSSASDTWSDWCEHYETTSSSAATNYVKYVWGKWVQSGTSTYGAPTFVAQKAKPLTDEEKAEQARKREADRVAAIEKARIAAEQARLAAEKAEQLLESLLDPTQLKSYRKSKKFFLTGSDGVCYELDCNKYNHNVHSLDDKGKRKTTYCAHLAPVLGVPAQDNFAAQKLALETDAVAFKKVANSWPAAV